MCCFCKGILTIVDKPYFCFTFFCYPYILGCTKSINKYFIYYYIVFPTISKSTIKCPNIPYLTQISFFLDYLKHLFELLCNRYVITELSDVSLQKFVYTNISMLTLTLSQMCSVLCTSFYNISSSYFDFQ